ADGPHRDVPLPEEDAGPHLLLQLAQRGALQPGEPAHVLLDFGDVRDDLGGDPRDDLLDLLLGEAERLRGPAVEPPGVVAHRRVAARPHVVDDPRRGLGRGAVGSRGGPLHRGFQDGGHGWCPAFLSESGWSAGAGRPRGGRVQPRIPRRPAGRGWREGPSTAASSSPRTPATWRPWVRVHRWPAPGRMRNSAPGTASATARLTRGGHSASAAPQITAVGQRTRASDGPASVRVACPASWRRNASGPTRCAMPANASACSAAGAASANIAGSSSSRTTSPNPPERVRSAMVRQAAYWSGRGAAALVEIAQNPATRSGARFSTSKPTMAPRLRPVSTNRSGAAARTWSAIPPMVEASIAASSTGAATR